MTDAGSILPYPLFEFGFPDTNFEPRPLPQDSQFSSGPASDFMASPAGEELRRSERKYAATTRQLIVRNTRLTGANIVFLGSGASRGMLALLRRAPASAVFVDVDQLALDRVARDVRSEGLDATVQVEFVCRDAFEWVTEAAETYVFDAVVATKCVGQILKGGRRLSDFADGIGGIMRHGGHLYMDHHVCMAGHPEGTPMADVLSGADFELGSIAGRYGSDVAYSCDSDLPDFHNIAHFVTTQSPSGVQVWKHFVFRFMGREPVKRASAMSLVALPPTPVPFVAPPLGDIDTTVEAMLPINAKGVKRVFIPSDIQAFPASLSTPKVDGEPGVALVDGSTLLFLSSRGVFARELTRDISPPLSLFAELVDAGAGRSVIVVTGVIEVDGRPCDPLDPRPLRRLEPVLDELAPDGVMVNSPRLLRHVVGDRLVLGAREATQVVVPVDGIQVLVAGKGGVFIKPQLGNTIDALCTDAPALIAAATAACGGTVSTVQLPDGGEGVYEFLEAEPGVWVPGRRRKDKAYSDPLGSAIQTIWASYWARTVKAGSDTESLRRRVNY